MAPALAQTGQFVRITESAAGIVFELEVLGVRRLPSRNVTGWIRADATRENGALRERRPEIYATSMTLYEVNCPEKSYRALSQSYYDPRGLVLASLDDPEGRFLRAPPESVSYELVSAICFAAVEIEAARKQ